MGTWYPTGVVVHVPKKMSGWSRSLQPGFANSTTDSGLQNVFASGPNTWEIVFVISIRLGINREFGLLLSTFGLSATLVPDPQALQKLQNGFASGPNGSKLWMRQNHFVATQSLMGEEPMECLHWWDGKMKLCIISASAVSLQMQFRWMRLTVSYRGNECDSYGWCTVLLTFESFRPSATASRIDQMESYVSSLSWRDPPPLAGWPPLADYPPSRDGWLGRSAFALTKRTCCWVLQNTVHVGALIDSLSP